MSGERPGEMKVTILGCGGSAGVPMLGGEDGHGIWGRCDPAEPKNRRSRASILLEMGNGENILVDTSPDIRAQLLTNGIKAFRSILYPRSRRPYRGVGRSPWDQSYYPAANQGLWRGFGS